jgi:hypothetical protein
LLEQVRMESVYVAHSQILCKYDLVYGVKLMLGAAG